MFENRVDAGRRLATAIRRLHLKDPIVLAIPRGGVVVGYEVAKELRAELDIIVPRKLRAPQEPEAAIGAVMQDGSVFLNDSFVSILGVSESYIEKEKRFQIAESKRRLAAYRNGRPYPKLQKRIALVVDDGVATGATMIAALRWLKSQNAERVIAAIPVAPLEIVDTIRRDADQVVCLDAPALFFAVGQFYNQFDPVDDEYVIKILKGYWSSEKYK